MPNDPWSMFAVTLESSINSATLICIIGDAQQFQFAAAFRRRQSEYWLITVTSSLLIPKQILAIILYASFEFDCVADPLPICVKYGQVQRTFICI